MQINVAPHATAVDPPCVCFSSFNNSYCFNLSFYFGKCLSEVQCVSACVLMLRELEPPAAETPSILSPLLQHPSTVSSAPPAAKGPLWLGRKKNQTKKCPFNTRENNPEETWILCISLSSTISSSSPPWAPSPLLLTGDSVSKLTGDYFLRDEQSGAPSAPRGVLLRAILERDLGGRLFLLWSV